MSVCVVPSCDAPVRVISRQLCRLHYDRWYRFGDPEASLTRRAPGLNGSCEVSGCTVKAIASGYCPAHYQRNKRHGGVLADQPVRKLGPRDPGSYRATHGRLKRERGAASDLACVDCGSQARHWSYDRSDAAERVETLVTKGRSYRVAYSTDISRYEPRCARCHHEFDRRAA